MNKRDMSAMKKLLLLLMFCVFLGSCSGNDAEQPLLDESELKEFVRAEMAAYGVPGIQVCVRDITGNKTIAFSLGYSNLQTKAPLDNSTRIKIGSMTKSFTAMGILLLAQQGRIDLNDEIGKYVNTASDAYRHITIKQLMNMNSGLRGYINDDDSDYITDLVIADPSRQFTPEELVAYGFALTDEQGMTGASEFHYNNTNYILLGMVLENVSGMSFAEFVRQEIVEPLGLPATDVPLDNKYGNNVSNGYYINRKENTTEDYSALDLSYVWSAGTVISTASDLCKWMTLIGTNRVVSGSVRAYVYDGLVIQAGGIHYTSGLINEPDRLWHNGTVLGYHGEMCYLKNKGIAIAVLSNCSLAGIDGDPIKEIMNEIIRRVNN